MKLIRVFLGAGCCVLAGSVAAQSMAIAWDLYVFPSNQQSAETQMNDELECMQWSRQMTGVDPGNPGAGVVTQAAPQGGEGRAAAGGAVRGAARAGLIGNIADEDASDYALAGALIGSVRGARRREQANQQAAAQAQAQAQAQAAERMGTFKKAFSACMEGKSYTVR